MVRFPASASACCVLAALVTTAVAHEAVATLTVVLSVHFAVPPLPLLCDGANLCEMLLRRMLLLAPTAASIAGASATASATATAAAATVVGYDCHLLRGMLWARFRHVRMHRHVHL